MGYDTHHPSSGRVKKSSGTEFDCLMLDSDHHSTGVSTRLLHLSGHKRGDPQINRLAQYLDNRTTKSYAAPWPSHTDPAAAPQPGSSPAPTPK